MTTILIKKNFKVVYSTYILRGLLLIKYKINQPIHKSTPILLGLLMRGKSMLYT